MPLPYPHRATFLASSLVVPLEQSGAAPHAARLLSIIIYDQLLRHPVVTLGDDDERLLDEQGRLLDANHPHIEDSIEWLFRLSRRHEVLWFEISIDRQRPQATLLQARLPSGSRDEWTSSSDLPLSLQLGQCLAQWLQVRRLPMVKTLPEFTVDELRTASERLAKAAAMLSLQKDLTHLPAPLLQPPPKLAIPYLRALAEMAGGAARTIDPMILALDPQHPVARRNTYVTKLMQGGADRREILPLLTEAPMYGKPHLSIWGEPFASERAIESMSVRHQGIAASLMPANPYACHNYSVQLAERSRLDEAYRWADRATVASPDFGAAQLDCVRRLRQLSRPGQAFAEAQFRQREILDRAADGKLSSNDGLAPHHAELLVALAHLDIGRLSEAVELAEKAIARLPDDAVTKETFAWASKRLSHWKTDAGLLARAYAWEGFYRGDPGRAIAGLARGRITDDDDALIMIDSLLAVGRVDQAEIAYQHCAGLDGPGLLGDGKARLASARALIIAGKLDEAFEQIQIVQLRRGESRLEAEINRVLRLVATRPAQECNRVIETLLARGAARLARMAARDLADFVPGIDDDLVMRAHGDTNAVIPDARWLKDLIAALPALHGSSAAILGRLARPDDDTLAAADLLAQEWWTVLVPATKDRDAHAAGAVLAAGVALAQYFAEATAAASPIAGAYRHIATEALHLVRRARYQIEPTAIRALLTMIERLGGAPDWLFDTWLLRVERALDLEAEHGSYLDAIVTGLPIVQRHLRGDERAGWELRFAHDLAADPAMYEPAAALFERSARAMEAGRVYLAWSGAAAASAPAERHVDVHWLAAVANPAAGAAPWLAVAKAMLAMGRLDDGFDAACRALMIAPAADRPALLADLGVAWQAAGMKTPLDGAEAYDAGLTAAGVDQLALAIRHLHWAHAVEPTSSARAHALAVALTRAGDGRAAVRVLAAHERSDAPRSVGHALVDAARYAEAIPILRYASRRFRTHEDWALLATTAHHSSDDAIAVEAGRHAVRLGSREPDVLIALATGLYRLGEFVECEQIARQLIELRGTAKETRAVGLHAMARALAGQGRHVDAHPYAKEAERIVAGNAFAAELAQTMECIVAQETPPIREVAERTMERGAWADLEAGRFDTLVTAVTSPSWGITRAALAACEFRSQDENGMPVAPRAITASVGVLVRTVGTTNVDATLARIRALRIRDNAFIQIDTPPPLGARMTTEEFLRAYQERAARPHRPSAILSYAR